MSFRDDNARGKRGERLVARILDCAGIECEFNNDIETNIKYDILCKAGKKTFKIEVKSDFMAEKTGNIAIEYFNSSKQSGSGVTATEADIWAHCVKDGDNLTVWIANIKRLKKFIDTQTPYKVFNSGGDGNADLLIYKDFHILKAFYRIDNVSDKEVKQLVKKALDYEAQ